MISGAVTAFLILNVMHGGWKGGPRIQVPQTNPEVMVDGVFSKGEWQDAGHLDVPKLGRIYVQRSTEFVYIAFEYIEAPSGMVDLFISPAEGQIYDFHASAKLGERQLKDGQFPDWTWWNNNDWVANVSRVDSFEDRTFLPTPIREFQIRRSRFPSTVWHVHFALTAMGRKNETLSEVVFPNATGEKSADGWIELLLN
ncbi:MAG TPA: hypothetical protein VI756_17955 [Blastocatellia bacterium]